VIEPESTTCPCCQGAMHRIGEDVAERLKYADHLPLYRQSQIYASGSDLDRSTLADWVGRAAIELRPLHQRLFEHLKRSPKLFMNETRLPVLRSGTYEPRPVISGQSPATTGRGRH
jgi:transposase